MYAAIVAAIVAVAAGAYWINAAAKRTLGATQQENPPPNTFKYLGASELIPLSEVQNRKRCVAVDASVNTRPDFSRHLCSSL